MKNESSDRQKIKEVAARVAAEFTEKDVDEFDRVREDIFNPQKPGEKQVVQHSQQEKVVTLLHRDMTRISPFCPISRKLPRRVNIKVVNWWGTIEYEGEQLGIFDETVLLALLWIAKENKSHEFVSPRRYIGKIAGVGWGKKTYESIAASIHRLKKCDLTIDKKGDDGLLAVKNIIKEYVYNKKTHEYYIELHPALLNSKSYTRIDVKYRLSLKGDITKALYRFLLSHGNDESKYKFEYTLFFLCDAIHINKNLPSKKKRSYIRAALKELRSKKFITYGKVTKNDKVIGSRAGKSAYI